MFILIFSPGLYSVVAQNKNLKYQDYIYDPSVKTVQLYPEGNVIQNVIESSAIPLNQKIPLLLSFDVLAVDYEDFQVKIIHCNADWEPSSLSDLDYLNEYNEYNINNYDFSFNTRTEYVHYWFKVPRVKRSGNYILKVYRYGDEDALMLTRRFMVYESRIFIDSRVALSNTIALRRSNQQLDFTLDYSGLKVDDPFTQIQVFIRKNQRWDNAITDLQPTMFKQSANQIEYFFVNDRTSFEAGNEYRLFDLRTSDFTGQGVERIERDKNEIHAYLRADKSRADFAYSEVLDINGKYVINNLDRGPAVGNLQAQYVYVHFSLIAPEKLNNDVYVFGELSNWNKGDSNKMTWNSNKGRYETTLLLKQGWYNYLYLVDGPEPYYFEGNKYETENQYEILVYFTPRLARGERLVGYKSMLHNSRR